MNTQLQRIEDQARAIERSMKDATIATIVDHNTICTLASLIADLANVTATLAFRVASGSANLDL